MYGSQRRYFWAANVEHVHRADRVSTHVYAVLASYCQYTCSRFNQRGRMLGRSAWGALCGFVMV